MKYEEKLAHILDLLREEEKKANLELRPWEIGPNETSVLAVAQILWLRYHIHYENTQAVVNRAFREGKLCMRKWKRNNCAYWYISRPEWGER